MRGWGHYATNYTALSHLVSESPLININWFKLFDIYFSLIFFILIASKYHLIYKISFHVIFYFIFDVIIIYFNFLLRVLWLRIFYLFIYFLGQLKLGGNEDIISPMYTPPASTGRALAHLDVERPADLFLSLFYSTL